MRLMISGLCFALIGLNANANTNDPAKMNKFITQLMAKMTIEEKAGQLNQYAGDMAITGNSVRPNFKEDLLAGRLGSMLNVYTPKFTREIQQLAVEKTRLKIPLIFGFDVIHGHRTIFPIPLGEASTWDLPRIEDAARVAAKEASADGIHWTFAPMVDVSRDPRWGRIMEGSGEDPWLGSKIAVARVHGFQGKNDGALDRILACVKHFAVYGAPTAGRDYNSVDMSERELREVYLPPYKAAIDAGAATVMTSFNDLNGIPATANSYLLTDILRKEWGFKGFVVTDFTAIKELIPHGVAANEKDAALVAFNAGSEMDMMSGDFSKYIPELVKEKKISIAKVDVAVRRILEAKYKLGLFDNPYRFSDEARAATSMLTPEHRSLARELGRRSLVLLKNANQTLPLKRHGKIAVIGPLGKRKRDMVGNWAAAGSGMREYEKAISLYDGIVSAVGEKAKVTYARGANFIEDQKLISLLNSHDSQLDYDSRTAEDMIKEAVKVAKDADIVIMAIGESQGMSGEAASRTSIRVPEGQQDLLKAIKKVGKPIVTVLFNGRPLALELENRLSDAMIEAWFPGTEAGNAIADVLFGDYNPSGKLTVSFPRNEGQIPVYYAHRNTGRPYDGVDKYRSQYYDSLNTPLYAFGYGLSYTKFEYSEPKLSTEKLKRNQTLKVTVNVKNAGDYDGEETAQLYINDQVASVARPVKLLRGFQKVMLKKGESKDLTFEITLEDLKFYDKNMKWVAEPGKFNVHVGGASDSTKFDSFILL